MILVIDKQFRKYVKYPIIVAVVFYCKSQESGWVLCTLSKKLINHTKPVTLW